MRIVVLGATSRTGRLLVDEASARGHTVVAFTRRPEILEGTAGVSAVVRGDGRDPAMLGDALDGAEAVISLLPGGGRKDPRLATEVARCLVTAMPAAGVRRLVAVSAYPVVADRPRVPIWMLRRLLAVPYADVTRMEDIITASVLDWTVVRLNRLTDKPGVGGAAVSRQLLAHARSLTRADAAAVLLDVVADDLHAGAAVNVGG